ncbi:MAG TPA: 3-oxoacyl-[acyl-carrier-protein] reductase [Bacteroidales bacterium]|jgi:3-oxoacyl-[acyl-carrier protein] reductase|nr:3-oxoacyl-[acyl-carrier-protein] reductase [Bacteroidales bacterium]OQB65621.1 MAG: 3-oxoacyl-(acyl-carrier-protein) reductase FabG [Bacteroidetes bacterium ADurb.Bin145]HOU01164.1 3-oxoacyl-[acyl-carrier-protein] reductase [Bacteroidales bacterium]HQG63740.1 3-oxoacyl-[acyl-carrier-protein] reductase [Bacteroidales bacterium]HQK68879.1 3-oxoacyl-[acyl-carrier-protein] reductase [Bacteroidales bacterium]
MGLLTGKTALITGASRGIGKAIALKFAKEGADIAITNIADDEEFRNAVKEIGQYGTKTKGYVSNAADFADSQRVAGEIIKDFSGIDILVNNAGITRDTLLMRMTEEQWDTVISVNLKSVFNLTKAVIMQMVKRNGGSIINMSSVVGVSGNAGQSNYAASKGGIISFTKSIAKEMGSRNIRCNAIAPGFIISEMTDKLPENIKTEWINKIPLKRGGTPEDVANVSLFLASELSSYVNGQIIHVCGGMLT